MNLKGAILVTTLLAVGCATVPPTPAARAITSESLLQARPLVGEGAAISLPDTDILALDPQMLEFLDRFVDADQSDRLKFHQLIKAIADEDTLGLVYDNQTHTAAETFDLQRGNCLSLTNMFVTMARHVGIDAHFQEVDIPSEWSDLGGLHTLNRHVNMYVNLGAAGKHEVDFTTNDLEADYNRRRVHDRRAFAHYYNNMGVGRMLAGDTVEALLNFREAIDNDRDFSPAWGNLGTLYRRNGHLAHAEGAYLQALDVNPKDLVAMSNLAALYGKQGDAERAAEYSRHVNAHRMRNPYYRYRLGQEAYFAGDYEGAIRHLKYAVRRKENEHSFYFLLGQSYLQMGDTNAASRWLAKSEEISSTDALKSENNSKIQMLLVTSPQAVRR